MPRNGVRGFSGAALRRGRSDAALRTDELAALVGVSRQTVTAWENGTARPSPAALRTLASTLRITTGDLVPIRESDLRISDLRALAGLTQEQVGAHVGLSTTAVGDLERGFRVVDDHLVELFSGLYDVRADRVRAVWQQTNDYVATRLKHR